jgi:hypothetical protein
MPDNQDRGGDHEPDRVRFTLVAPAGMSGAIPKVRYVRPRRLHARSRARSAMRIMTMTIRSLVAVALLATTTPGFAADRCGDADSSGSVTVTDGVQTLRAAAGLGSSCTLARCDVDDSGSVSVTDGVNVLRAAAGLAVVLACPGTGPMCATATVTVALAVPAPIGAGSLVLAYPASDVALPGSGDAATARVTVLNPGSILADGQPNDLDDRIVFSLVATDGLDDGDLLTAQFDCLGAAPAAARFACTLADVFAPDGVTPRAGATCSVRVASE